MAHLVAISAPLAPVAPLIAHISLKIGRTEFTVHTGTFIQAAHYKRTKSGSYALLAGSYAGSRVPAIIFDYSRDQPRIDTEGVRDPAIRGAAHNTHD